MEEFAPHPKLGLSCKDLETPVPKSSPQPLLSPESAPLLSLIPRLWRSRESASTSLQLKADPQAGSHTSPPLPGSVRRERPRLSDPPALGRAWFTLPPGLSPGLRPTQLRPGAEPRVTIGWSPAGRGARIAGRGHQLVARRRPRSPPPLLRGPIKGFRLAGRGHVSTEWRAHQRTFL